MVEEAVRAHLAQFGLADRYMDLAENSATVELAAKALGCEPQRIAKTLAFRRGDGAALIVAAGDARVDNAKFRAYFGERARMLQGDEVLTRTGHAPGGVCPFAVRPGAQVYLDVSLKRFDTVYPAGGNAHSAVRLSLEELERASQFCDWIDVCGGYNP